MCAEALKDQRLFFFAAETMCARFQTVRACTLINFDERFLGGALWKKNEEKRNAPCLRFLLYSLAMPNQPKRCQTKVWHGGAGICQVFEACIYFSQVGLLSPLKSLAGVRLGRSKAS